MLSGVSLPHQEAKQLSCRNRRLGDIELGAWQPHPHLTWVEVQSPFMCCQQEPLSCSYSDPANRGWIVMPNIAAPAPSALHKGAIGEKNAICATVCYGSRRLNVPFRSPPSYQQWVSLLYFLLSLSNALFPRQHTDS